MRPQVPQNRQSESTVWQLTLELQKGVDRQTD